MGQRMFALARQISLPHRHVGPKEFIRIPKYVRANMSARDAASGFYSGGVELLLTSSFGTIQEQGIRLLEACIIRRDLFPDREHTLEELSLIRPGQVEQL